MAACKFDKAWIGPCGQEAGPDGFCPKHGGLRCCACGAQATRECDMTGIQFVCGFPLCDDCEHGPLNPDNPGIFNLGGGHRRKPNLPAAEPVGGFPSP